MNKSYLRVDFSLLIPVLILVIFGLSGIFSLNSLLFRSQLIFSCLSIVVFFIFSQINYKNIKTYAVPIYIASIVLLSVVLLIGAETRGSVRWIEFFGFQIQFSEILKPFLAISLASYLSNLKGYSLKSLISVLIILLPIFLLIFFQPDLGNALIYLITVLLVLFTFGFPMRFFLGLFAFGLLSFPILWGFLRSYQKHRVLTFLQIQNDPLGTSYNAIQSVIAVGSGMILGKGFGQGTQSILRFLPERHTDFIFATLSEEIGFIGSLALIATFIFLLYRIFSISLQSDNIYAKTFSICAFFLLSVQFLVNVGMNLGIVPVVGVSLPFVSYGGSSLVTNFIFLGILSAISRDIKKKGTLEIR